MLRTVGVRRSNRRTTVELVSYLTYPIHRGVARGPLLALLRLIMKFQIFRLNFSRDMFQIHYFSNKLFKIDQSWGLLVLRFW